MLMDISVCKLLIFSTSSQETLVNSTSYKASSWKENSKLLKRKTVIKWLIITKHWKQQHKKCQHSHQLQAIKDV